MDETFHQYEKQDFFKDILKRSDNMYERLGSRFFKTTDFWNAVRTRYCRERKGSCDLFIHIILGDLIQYPTSSRWKSRATVS